MKDTVKIALIIAISMVICVGIYQYFSPYHSCVRMLTEEKISKIAAADNCAKRLGGGGN